MGMKWIRAREIFEGKREKHTGFLLGYVKERDCLKI
jgi:hypothetical protein